MADIPFVADMPAALLVFEVTLERCKLTNLIMSVSKHFLQRQINIKNLGVNYAQKYHY